MIRSPERGEGTVTVTVNRSDKTEGEYTGNLQVESNGGNRTVDILMQVEGVEKPSVVENVDVRGFTGLRGCSWWGTGGIVPFMADLDAGEGTVSALP